MQFHLNFQPKGTQNQITHQDEILFMGSCFSEHIASRMSELKFHVNTNPFGIVFNPKSMLLNLNRMLYKDYFTVNDVFEKDRIWYSFDAHSSLYASSQFELLNVFVNGLKLRYDIDFIPTTTQSIQMNISIPSGSEMQYISIKRP